MLFVGFAIAQGIGEPSVPSNAVAVVKDAPDGLGTITEEEFAHALEQAAAAAQVKPVPRPGDEKYDELKETALTEILDEIWIQGQAEEMGITVTPEEAQAELKKLKSLSFKTEKQYQEFLKEAKYTQADVDERVKLQILGQKAQKQVTAESPTPSAGEIEDYYEAAKSSTYTREERREARALFFKEKEDAEKAKAELEEDDSPRNWDAVAAKSDNATNRRNGGVLSESAEDHSVGPLHMALFAAQQGQVEGPLSVIGGYEVYEVMSITPEKVLTLEEVEVQIRQTLEEGSDQERLTSFVSDFNGKWTSRTFCAEGFVFEKCANFKGTGHAPEASPACYEANPKSPAEVCPAPVTQAKPAEPGSITPLTQEGRRLPQAPHPAGAPSPPSYPIEAPDSTSGG
jgi:parvulin-like peptidyl-prolyl isomerase